MAINSYQESCDEWNYSTICRQPISNGSHSMLPDTKSNICAGVVSKASARRLEINRVFDLCQIAASQIS
jgi:hypothetical protein